jgi:hypothetical protein
MALGVSLWAGCGLGPEVTQAQMACCAGTDHDCQSARADRECCRTHAADHTQMAATVKQQVLAPVLSSALALLATPAPPASAMLAATDVSSRARLKASPPPKYLLNSAFLI